MESVIKSAYKLLALVACSLSLLSCASPDDPNAAAKRGAVGGALIGLTAGVLTGDSELALKGAAMGGVTGGVAGSMEDLNASRESQRTDTLAAAIASNNNNSSTGNAQAPASWDRLDSLIGNWNASIFAASRDGQTVDVTASAKGKLVSTTEAELNFKNVVIDGQENPMTGRMRLGYTPSASYTLITDFALQGDDLVFAGEFDRERNIYTYYPTGTLEGEAFTNAQSSNALIELRFVGDQVVILETFIRSKGEYVKIQALNLTRAN